MQKGWGGGEGGEGAKEGEELGLEEWDIDTDPIVDSGIGASEEGSISASPLRRQMGLVV